jgi:hypothetical protein
VVDSTGIQDYWGTEETIRWTLPDGIQWFEFKPMNEGDRAKYQKMTNQDMVFDQQQRNARVRMDQSRDRHQLIVQSVVNWNLFVRDPQSHEMVEQPFAKRSLEMWLEKAPPKIVDDLEFQIRLGNPWMQADMKPDDIKTEIDRLYELLRQAEEREAGEPVSVNK